TEVGPDDRLRIGIEINKTDRRILIEQAGPLPTGLHSGTEKGDAHLAASFLDVIEQGVIYVESVGHNDQVRVVVGQHASNVGQPGRKSLIPGWAGSVLDGGVTDRENKCIAIIAGIDGKTHLRVL